MGALGNISLHAAHHLVLDNTHALSNPTALDTEFLDAPISVAHDKASQEPDEAKDGKVDDLGNGSEGPSLGQDPLMSLEEEAESH